MFIAIINSATLALVVGIITDIAGADFGRKFLASAIVFLVTLTIFNAYSRMVILRFRGLVNINLWEDSPAWAARE
jgi:hypothetical protein